MSKGINRIQFTCKGCYVSSRDKTKSIICPLNFLRHLHAVGVDAKPIQIIIRILVYLEKCDFKTEESYCHSNSSIHLNEL